MQALLECASTGDCSKAIEKLVLFVALIERLLAIQSTGAFGGLISLALWGCHARLARALVTSVLTGSLPKLVLERVKIKLPESTARSGDTSSGIDLSKVVSLKKRSCRGSIAFLTMLTSGFQLPGFISKLTKLEFATSSLRETKDEIIAVNYFLVNFEGLNKLFVFSYSSLL